jgi:imidazolonepropionase-like amidohydrolase
MTDPLARRLVRIATVCAVLTAAALPGFAGPASPRDQEMVVAPVDSAGSPEEQSDLAGARDVFERNVRAIQQRDMASYVGCYLDSERLIRTGPEGFELGIAGLKAGLGTWPDHLSGDDLHLTWLRPGVVYGTYRYRVRYGAQEDAGISERLFVSTANGWRIALTTAFSSPDAPAAPLALVGAALLDGTGTPALRDSVVLLREGKIECAGSRATCPIPSTVDRLDLKGLWLTPGLIDAHVHFAQTGWADGRPDSIDVREKYPYAMVEKELREHPERFGRTALCSGVTAEFDVGGYPWSLDLPAWAEDRTDVPRLRAAGPLLSTIDPGINLPAERQFILLTNEDSAREGVRYLASHGANAVKVWYIVPRGHSAEDYASFVLAAGDEAQKHKLPLIVHATGLAEAKIALRAGAKLLVHSVGDLPLDQEFLDLAKKNGTIYCPTRTVIGGYRRMFAAALAGTVPTIDDPNGCVDPETRARIEETARVGVKDVTAASLTRMSEREAKASSVEAANLRQVAAAGIPIAMGTDAGNPLTLHGISVYAEMEAMQADGLKPIEVLTSATLGGAQAMGRDKELGSIVAGKLADLLIVGADPTVDIANLRQVRFVVRGGVVRSIAELKALATTPPAASPAEKK